MKKVIIFGTTGMLGRYVKTYLTDKYDIVEINRDKYDATYCIKDVSKLFSVLQWNNAWNSTIVNCVGMIKPQVDKYGTLDAIAVNSVFPFHLSNFCNGFKTNLIHITTDCVFSGKKGNYTENDQHDALDVYGKTKSLGEPPDATVIRTSIIGEEKENKRSLVEWIKSNAGKTVNGYVNHSWNGITCLQLAKCIEILINSGGFWKGVRHVYSPTSVTKQELVNLVNEVYGLGMTINPSYAKEPCDRTLKTESVEIGSIFDIPELRIQVEEMKNFKL